MQLALQRYDVRYRLVDRPTMERISGTALDFLIVAAVASVDVAQLAADIVPFLLLMLAGLLTDVACVLSSVTSRCCAADHGGLLGMVLSSKPAPRGRRQALRRMGQLQGGSRGGSQRMHDSAGEQAGSWRAPANALAPAPAARRPW